MKEISFAVVGAGFMGGLLARVASDLPNTYCAGAADVDESRSAALTAQCGGRPYGDFRALLANERPDAVLIATPENLHCEPALAAAAQGCHVYLEKPIATSLSDTDTIIAACRSANVKLMVGYILRFDASYAMIESAVRSGSVGPLLSIYARRIATIAEARRLGGRIGPITYIGVHDFDQMLWYHPVPVK
ncbi:MAG: Gfo/Idh/MocA family protein, partial [Rudaea sp.]